MASGGGVEAYPAGGGQGGAGGGGNSRGRPGK